ncbi:flagellar biosynthesis protein FlhB [Rickettsiales endosymbiont of Stachyamoeba lipophora]|uniref:flagellar biosynthesis protein FlhB n=1 Tax=Rickettsiales endosymbiont of Stachyamoeba lipophora TaxID=2486578 RepID=UPI000F64D0A0|nr:flagellar biosynthesis protein FlhB [Rickettsiales endosymbiont of Stachyamoeba lipophora]AZL15298.1 flagellar biosynthesis protein FlhB [Rickettsiales endosymbiont of Stachyamoeba lipophora]
MAESEGKDKDQATQDATPKRIEDAYKKGQIIYSKDVTTFLMLTVAILVLLKMLPLVLKSTFDSLVIYIHHPDQIDMNNPGYLSSIYLRILKDFSILISPLLVFLVITVIISPSMQNIRIIFNPEALKFDFSKISILAGLSRLFSMKSLVEFIKGIIKIIVIGFISYFVIKKLFLKSPIMHDIDVLGILWVFKENLFSLLVKIAIFLFFIAVFDYFFQRFKFFEDLKMTKQEIKEEFKESEGSPEVKSKLKRLRAEKSRKRMLAEVPKADVIITNPTHFAVALKYDMETMPAPILIAKGLDRIALKIREIASEHEVPIIENPPLARELYRLVDINEEIPLEYYQAVAEIISYVYKLKGKANNF